MPFTIMKSHIGTTEQVHMGGQTMFPFLWIRENEEKVYPHFGSHSSLVGKLIE